MPSAAAGWSHIGHGTTLAVAPAGSLPTWGRSRLASSWDGLAVLLSFSFVLLLLLDWDLPVSNWLVTGRLLVTNWFL